MIPPFDYNNMLNFITASTSDYGRGVNRGRRERITYTRKQLEILEDMFRQTHYPDVFKRENLSALLGIPEGRIQVWFKNRRARFRQSSRHPFHQHSNNSSMDSEDLKVSKTELPEIHRSPQASSSSNSSAESLSPAIIGIPKIDAYDDLKMLQPHPHPHHQQLPTINPTTGFDNLKDLYSMQIPMNGNFWQTTNWQNPSSYYPVPYPTSYHHPTMPTTNSAAAAFYGYPSQQQHPSATATAASVMQQSYQSCFYPSYPVVGNNNPVAYHPQAEEKEEENNSEDLMPKTKE